MEKRIEHINKITQIIAKYPISFVAAVFFCMFWVTYYINIRKNDENEETWKELYIKEREDKDRFRNQLLIKAGIIEAQRRIIQQNDTLLRNETIENAEQILKCQ